MKTIISIALILSCISIKSQITHNPEEIVKQIRIEFNKINRIKLDCKMQDLNDVSTEGGEMKKCYDGQDLRKAIFIFYRETEKLIVEYYFKDKKIIFSNTKEDRYNAPIYIEGGGKIASTMVSRYYFSEGELIRWLGKDNKIVDVEMHQS